MFARKIRSALAFAVGSLLVRLWPGRFQFAPFCFEKHQVGPIRLSHHTKVPCQVALWVAEHARKLWENLRTDFPEETVAGVDLEVVWRRYSRMGWARLEYSRAAINLACFSLDINHPSFREQERTLRGVIAEELHHIAYYRRYGRQGQVFEVDEESNQYEFERILYYSLNPHEYAALQFCVRETEDRVGFLKLVEAHRQKGSEFP